MDHTNFVQEKFLQRLGQLYPMVDLKETPVPTCWSQKDKFQDIGLTQNNMRAHYKGNGKSNKDAASVRANHPIPTACGLFYFEVKIVSKGRDGYMGVGLTQLGTNLNRLPGWEKYSYGYHGDDGHVFNSATTGRSYGPTFSTGDVIGCGLNLVDNTCFYTKNGHNLGVAAYDLRTPGDLYPTVGLQTPGETVDVNFGQLPFMFDIEDVQREVRSSVLTSVHSLAPPASVGCWQQTLHRMVQTYLVHHGYCATAEAFANGTGVEFDEDLSSIRHRQKIQQLVLDGRMGEAIEITQRLYPGLLEKQQNLLFLLRVRQFIEMINGTDSEVINGNDSPLPPLIEQQQTSLDESDVNSDSDNGRSHSSSSSPSLPSSLSASVGAGESILPDSLSLLNQQQQPTLPPSSSSSSLTASAVSAAAASHMTAADDPSCCSQNCDSAVNSYSQQQQKQGKQRGMANGHSHDNGHSHTARLAAHDDEECMEVDRPSAIQLASGPSTANGTSTPADGGGQHVHGKRRGLCSPSGTVLEKVLQFGKQLHLYNERLKATQPDNDYNKNLLQDAFSLLAYTDPSNSPVKWQLDPIQREAACAALNSAILSSHNLPRRAPLEVALSHSKELVALMARAGLGSCAFANIDALFHQ